MISTAWPMLFKTKDGHSILSSNTSSKYYLRSYISNPFLTVSQSERFIATPAQGPVVVANSNPSLHGNGPIQVSLPAFSLLLDQLVVKAAKVLGGRFPFNLDMATGNMVGFGMWQALLLGFCEV